MEWNASIATTFMGGSPLRVVLVLMAMLVLLGNCGLEIVVRGMSA